jgi:serine-type D-Ala-D-Ala carboxypeptidase (penicillin-binding protein 5/6)
VAQARSEPTSPLRQPPASALTQWVQVFRPTSLWSSERSDAANLDSLPQWTVVRHGGSYAGSRLAVEYPGDGLTRLPQRGWLDAADLAPSGPPNPEIELASGGNISPTSGVAVPRRTVQAWPQGISAQYAALIDGDSGEILWGRNARGRVAPASLTKIVTALVALDRGRLSDRVAVQVDSRTMYESTVMGLTPGETVSMETLLYGLMLPSGNDAALAIAQQVGGSESGFVSLMNAKATQLGLANSHFLNPHGLDADGHYSSPADLIAFSRAGMRDATFARLSGARHYDGEGYSMNNLNRLLALYPKADGVKVGYTDNAGRAIVASATQDGHRLYAALLRSANPTAEAQALLEWAFRGFAWP